MQNAYRLASRRCLHPGEVLGPPPDCRRGAAEIADEIISTLREISEIILVPLGTAPIVLRRPLSASLGLVPKYMLHSSASVHEPTDACTSWMIDAFFRPRRRENGSDPADEESEWLPASACESSCESSAQNEPLPLSAANLVLMPADSRSLVAWREQQTFSSASWRDRYRSWRLNAIGAHRHAISALEESKMLRRSPPPRRLPVIVEENGESRSWGFVDSPASCSRVMATYVN